MATKKSEANGKLAKTKTEENWDISPIFTEPEPEIETTATIKIEGIETDTNQTGKLSAEVGKAIAYCSRATGMTPENLIGKVLSDVFSSEDFSLIRLYRQLAVQQEVKEIQQQREQLEQLKQQKRNELAMLEVRSQF